jgi:hypothetical protein
LAFHDGFTSRTAHPTSLEEVFAGIHGQAIEQGDLRTAAVCAFQYCLAQIFSGKALSDVERSIASYQGKIAAFGEHQIALVMWHLRQLTLILLGRSEEVSAADDDEWSRQAALHGQEMNFRARASGMKMMSHHLMRQYEPALQAALDSASVPDWIIPLVPFNCYRCLILLDRHPLLSEAQRQQYRARASEYQRQLAWQAQQAPKSYQHKLDLVEADRGQAPGRAPRAGAAQDPSRGRKCLSPQGDSNGT